MKKRIESGSVKTDDLPKIRIGDPVRIRKYDQNNSAVIGIVTSADENIRIYKIETRKKANSKKYDDNKTRAVSKQNRGKQTDNNRDYQYGVKTTLAREIHNLDIRRTMYKLIIKKKLMEKERIF